MDITDPSRVQETAHKLKTCSAFVPWMDGHKNKQDDKVTNLDDWTWFQDV